MTVFKRETRASVSSKESIIIAFENVSCRERIRESAPIPSGSPNLAPLCEGC